MNLNDYCAPALLYVAFSLTHIIIDLFKHLYNTALVKFIVMIIFTFLLNLLCQRGLTVISWFIVFIPFITMTVITTLLLIIFGLSPFTGKVEKTHLQPGHHIAPDNNIKPDNHIKPGHHHDKKCKGKHHSIEHDKFYN